MNIGIIGGGSLGLLYSYYLSQAHDISLYVRRHEQKETLNSQGLTLIGQGNVDVKAYHNLTEFDHDIIIFALKQADLSVFLSKYHDLFVEQTLIFIQNGMSHLEHLHYFDNPILLGIVEHGAARLNDHTVEHNGVGQTRLARYQGRGAKELVERLTREDFKFVFESDWESMLSNKLLVNAVINPMTALFEVKNGELLEDEYLKKLTYLVFDEVCTHLKLPKDESKERLEKIISSTANNTSSMLTDIIKGEKTEIEAILGYLIKASENESPVLSMLYNSIKYKENRSVSDVRI